MNKIETILQSEINNKVKNDVILYKGEIFTFFDCGLTRYVFTNNDKTKVIKLLISERGKDYNEEEYFIYENLISYIAIMLYFSFKLAVFLLKPNMGGYQLNSSNALHHEHIP